MEDTRMSRNSRRVDQESGAVVYPPDSAAIQEKRRQQNQLNEILTGIKEIKQEVSILSKEVKEIKTLMLSKSKNS